MPIYTDSDEFEVSKVDDFLDCLRKLGLKKYVESKKFNEIVETLKTQGCLMRNE